jgi:5-formyltetrahydrofolate cyclo-ligase
VTDDSINRAKQEIREHVWELLEREHVTEPGVRGYIPAFAGADAAASLLAGTTEWRAARVIKAVPDRAQQPVRERALLDGKLLYMAVPKLAEDPPFYELNPHDPLVSPAEASSREVAVKVGRKIGTGQMRPVDMVVCGSVAVNQDGTRLGKGAGYSDIEVALLAEAGLISPRTLIVTTVHPLQVIGEPIPETGHDFSVDLIVTTQDLIRCEPPRRPRGLDWDQLPASMIAAIPVLSRRAPSQGR